MPSVWLRADAVNGLNAQGNPNALPANNAQLPFWGDTSGNNGRNTVQPNGAQQPRFITNAVNGKPVVRFDGSSVTGQGDFMNIPGAFANTDLAKLTLFIVSNDNRVAGDINNKDILSTRDNRGNGWVETYEPNSVQQRYVHIGLGSTSNSVTDDNLGTDGFHVLELRRDGFNIELGHDGGLQVTDRLDEFKPTTLGVTQIGNNNNDRNRFFRGDIAEIIAFDGTKLTDAQRNQVERYLLDKYTIASAPGVPEPTSLAFLGIAGAAVLGGRRRR